MRSRFLRTIAACWLVAGTSLFAQAAGGPLDVVRSSNQEVLDLYAAAGDEISDETTTEVFAVIDSVTDFSRLADRALDGLCDAEAGDDCERFATVFVELLRVSSIKKLGRYRADNFDYLSESLDGEAAVIETLAYYGDDEIGLVYYLERREDRWKIVNYVVDGVDTIENYRKQFNRLLRRDSVDEVIARLERRIEALESED